VTGRIVIVPYDPSWPNEFELEAALVRTALGQSGIAAEHVGSTAVVGLAAKPIIDLMIGVRGLGEARSKVGALEALGYRYMPEFEAQIPERLFFQRGEPRTHHVHLAEITSTFWQRQLLFRDYLRGHPDVARDYQALKEDLAARFGHAREAYTQAKTAFIETVLEQARAASRGVQGGS
jgi:GrpB-like predicted nucleotidyltransferase (UPF0157 family)